MRTRFAPAAVVVLALGGSAAVALAQHHHRHHHHGSAASTDTQGPPPPDAGVAPASPTPGHRPTEAPTQGGSGNCIQGTRVIAMRVPPPDAARPCHEATDCGIAQAACCAPCGVVEEHDVVAVEVSAVPHWNAALCDDDTTCPRCASRLSPTISATCIEGLCEVMVRDDCSSGPGPVRAPPRDQGD